MVSAFMLMQSVILCGRYNNTAYDIILSGYDLFYSEFKDRLRSDIECNYTHAPNIIPTLAIICKVILLKPGLSHLGPSQ